MPIILYTKWSKCRTLNTISLLQLRLAASKQTMPRFHVERFNLKKLNKVEHKEQYRVEISNRFTALENSDAEVDVNRA
jgi:hypothetical protein